MRPDKLSCGCYTGMCRCFDFNPASPPPPPAPAPVHGRAMHPARSSSGVPTTPRAAAHDPRPEAVRATCRRLGYRGGPLESLLSWTVGIHPAQRRPPTSRERRNGFKALGISVLEGYVEELRRASGHQDSGGVLTVAAAKARIAAALR